MKNNHRCGREKNASLRDDVGYTSPRRNAMPLHSDVAILPETFFVTNNEEYVQLVQSSLPWSPCNSCIGTDVVSGPASAFAEDSDTSYIHFAEAVPINIQT